MSRLPQLIVVGVLVWALVLAVGAYLGPAKDRGISSGAAGAQVDPDLARRQQLRKWGRGALVLGCTTVFVVFWTGMLLARRRRLQREQHEVEDSDAE
jgi:hypothetical protein